MSTDIDTLPSKQHQAVFIFLRLLVALFFSSFFSISFASQNDLLAINDSWIRQAPPNVKVLAGYLQINNRSNKKRTLIRVSSDQFDKVEIHRSTEHDGMMHMQQQDKVIIPAQQNVLFEPNGLHLMLIKPRKYLVAGDHVKLVFLFKNGKVMNIDAAVQKRKTKQKINHQHH